MTDNNQTGMIKFSPKEFIDGQSYDITTREQVQITIALEGINYMAQLGRDCYLEPRDQIAAAMKCLAYKLDPYIGDIYIIKHSMDKPAILHIACDALVRMASENPQYRGYRCGWKLQGSKKQIKYVGTLDNIDEGWAIIGAWGQALREGRETPPAVCEIKSFEKKNSPNWSVMPDIMIAKCARAMAHRLAFPERLGGLYASEEIEHLKRESADYDIIEGEKTEIGPDQWDDAPWNRDDEPDKDMPLNKPGTTDVAPVGPAALTPSLKQSHETEQVATTTPPADGPPGMQKDMGW